MVEAAKTSTDTTSMIQLAVPCFKMRMQEGLNTFDSMIAEGGDKVKVASKVKFFFFFSPIFFLSFFTSYNSSILL